MVAGDCVPTRGSQRGAASAPVPAPGPPAGGVLQSDGSQLAAGDGAPQGAGPAAETGATQRDPGTSDSQPATSCGPAVPPLPADLATRVEALRCGTLVHIPAGAKPVLASISAENLEDMARGHERGAILEQVSAKLLLAPVPPSERVNAEVLHRAAMWGRMEFDQLVSRIEVQQMRARSGPPAECPRARRRRRVCRLAREGAYSKATASTATETADVSSEEQRQWAEQLLPTSRCPERALARADAAGAEPLAEDAPRAAASRVDAVGDELRKIRFKPLSAAGPSGRRPEHLKEMAGVRRHRAGRRFVRALAAFTIAAVEGGLHPTARWILDSQLVYLRKKKGPAPRPVRIGEVLRRLVAKHNCARHASAIRKGLLLRRQVGVSVPGACESLVHVQREAERLLRSGAHGQWVAIDLDLVNCFCHFEWPAVRRDAAAAVPGLQRWLQWCTSEPVRVRLPSGEWRSLDRGAEQGDPEGSFKSSAVLAEVCRRTSERFAAGGSIEPSYCHSGAGAVDWWYVDDGRLIIRPERADAWLRIFDEELLAVGATRVAADGSVKSSARLLGAGALGEDLAFPWAGEHLRATCRFLAASARTEYLGVTFEGEGEELTDFQAAAEKAQRLREALADLGDPAVQVALLRSCADVGKVTYALRLGGVRLPEAELEAQDAGLRAALETSLDGPLADHGWRQASLGCKRAGLGFRRAAEVAPAAYVASITQAIPLAEDMDASFAEAGVFPAGVLAAAVASRRRDGLDILRAGIAPEAATEIMEVAGRGLDFMRERWECVRSGAPLPAAPGPSVDGPASEGLFLEDAGALDPEHPHVHSTPGLQQAMVRVLDLHRGGAELQRARREHRWDDAARLQELMDPSVDASWLWALNPQHGAHLDAEDFGQAVRTLLGADAVDGTIVCSWCEKVCLSGQCSHALACGSAGESEGHNRIRDVVHGLASIADPTTCLEPTGLVPSRRGARPADVLTHAASPDGGCECLDVGVTSPFACSAGGGDCVNAMLREKRRRLGDQGHAELRAQGLTYEPFVISCYGRLEAGADERVTRMARRAARRRGIARSAVLERRFRQRLAVEVWRRTVAVLRRCLAGREAEVDADLAVASAAGGC